MATNEAKNTVEDLFKRANEALEQQVRIPLIMNKLAERGYQPKTEEEAQQLMKVADEIAVRLAKGELAPIPVRELEETGELSKHAAAKSEQDFLAFAPEFEIDYAQVEDGVKSAAAVVAFVAATSNQE